MKRSFPAAPLCLAIFYLLQCATLIFGQSPVAAPAPAPPGPLNISGVLDKAGQFSTFIRLLQSTQETDQIDQQLNNSNQGLTIFAPTDSAFSTLKPGMLNSLSDQQKVQLIQFHILPTFLSMTQFQTASNPLRTQAGSSSDGEFPLNVTTSGNSVNITTGVVNTTVSNTIYTDGSLAVYQVDQVLVPLGIVKSPSAPAPAPSEGPKKGAAKSDDGEEDGSDDKDDSSGAVRGGYIQRGMISTVSFGSAVLAAFYMLL